MPGPISDSFKGQSGNTPLVPTWMDDEPSDHPQVIKTTAHNNPAVIPPRRAASAMSTGTAKTRKAVEGRSPASAARSEAEGNAQNDANIPTPSVSADVVEALNGYRAAVSFIGADAWDGCSDCMEILRAARSLDVTWDWAGDPNRIANELAKVRALTSKDQTNGK